MSLLEADRQLRKINPSKPFDFFLFFPSIGVLVSCTTVIAILLSMGRETTPFVLLILVPMIGIPVGLWLGDLLDTIREMQQSHEAFFGEHAQRERRRQAVVDQLARHPLSWIQQQLTQLQYAIKGQSQRLALLVGKPGDFGLVRVLVSGALFYISFKLPTEPYSQIALTAVSCVVVILATVYLVTFFHLEKLRALILVLELAQQQGQAQQTSPALLIDEQTSVLNAAGRYST